MTATHSSNLSAMREFSKRACTIPGAPSEADSKPCVENSFFFVKLSTTYDGHYWLGFFQNALTTQ